MGLAEAVEYIVYRLGDFVVVNEAGEEDWRSWLEVVVFSVAVLDKDDWVCDSEE